MKRISLFIVSVITIISFNGCAALNLAYTKVKPELKVAFGDAVRALEGMGISSIPVAVALIKQQAALWLPAGSAYVGVGSSLLASAINSFVAANPKDPAAINAALEAIATALQTMP